MADLVSILIPTRNRPMLARLCVETALENSDDDCEIVVADNGDTPLELPHHSRLRVLPLPPQPLAMPDNWERALDAAQGQWVMLLSDKYMLVPGAIPALRGCLTRSETLVYYSHGLLRQSLDPSEEDQHLSLASGGGLLSWAPAAAPRQVDSNWALERLFSSPGEYPIGVPMLYSALARRTLIEGARRPIGRFFFGPCPDVASALQLLAQSRLFLETRLPVVMIQYPNASPTWSTGASTQALGAVGRAFLDALVGTEADLIPIVSLLIERTLSNGRRILPTLAPLAPSWCALAATAAREIEGLPRANRPRAHLQLAAHLLNQGGGAASLWAQARAVLGVRAPRAVVTLYRKGKRLDGHALSDVCRAEVASRREALSLLGRELVQRQAAVSEGRREEPLTPPGKREFGAEQ